MKRKTRVGPWSVLSLRALASCISTSGSQRDPQCPHKSTVLTTSLSSANALSQGHLLQVRAALQTSTLGPHSRQATSRTIYGLLKFPDLVPLLLWQAPKLGKKATWKSMLPYKNVILTRKGRKTGKEIPQEENRDLIADQRTPKAVGATRS